MLTIELNETAEGKLRAEAKTKGVPPEVYAREILEGVLLPARTEGQKLLDELEEEGLLGAWKDRPESQNAQAYARELRQRAWSRNRED